MDLKSLLLKAAQEKRLKQDKAGLSLDGNTLWTPEKGVRLTLQNAAGLGHLDVEEGPSGIIYTRTISVERIEALFSAPAKKTRKGS